MIMDLDEVEAPKETAKTTITPIPSTSILSIPNPEAVVMKVLHTRTEIYIYPNGSTFQRSSSWFENSTYQVKKKEVKKAAPSKKVEKQGKEEY